MARAYIVQARNDVQGLLLQVPDLVPNTSQRNSVYDPPGQSGYLSYFHLMSVDVSGSDQGDGSMRTDADYYGIIAYLLDNVENVGDGNLALTSEQASQIGLAIATRIVNGQSLTLSDINTLINAADDVSDSDLNGAVANSDSTGSVEDVLRIMSGEVYLLPAGSQYANAAGAFPAGEGRKGGFLARPNVARALAHPGGRKGTEPAGTSSTSSLFRDIRPIIDTGDLHRSVLSGTLSALVSTGFVHINPAHSYGAGGTAQTITASTIGTDGAGRAVTVYAADGTVIG